MAKKETTPAGFVHAGEQVNITDRFRFYVVSLEREYDTAEQARGAIDRKEKAKAQIKREKLDYACVNGLGTAFKITGIHGSNANLITDPPNILDTIQFRTPYPDHPNVRVMIEEKTRLEYRVMEIESALERVRVGHHRWKYGRPEPEEIPPLYDQLAESYAKAMKEAEKLK